MQIVERSGRRNIDKTRKEKKKIDKISFSLGLVTVRVTSSCAHMSYAWMVSMLLSRQSNKSLICGKNPNFQMLSESWIQFVFGGFHFKTRKGKKKRNKHPQIEWKESSLCNVRCLENALKQSFYTSTLQTCKSRQKHDSELRKNEMSFGFLLFSLLSCWLQVSSAASFSCSPLIFSFWGIVLETGILGEISLQHFSVPASPLSVY